MAVGWPWTQQRGEFAESPAALLLLDKANLKASPLSDRYGTIQYNPFLKYVNTIFHSS
jgi:hypothetical protein